MGRTRKIARSGSVVLAATAVAAVAAACAGAGRSPPASGVRFADAWAAGQLREAIEVFEADPDLARDPTVAFRAGLAYAHPANPARDPRRARELLRFVAESDPAGALSRDAESVMALLDAEREQRLRSESLRRELDALKAIDLDGGARPATDSTEARSP